MVKVDLKCKQTPWKINVKDFILCSIPRTISIQARRNEKNSGGLRFYKKMLANLVSWLGRWFNRNHLKCPEILSSVEVGYANF